MVQNSDSWEAFAQLADRYRSQYGEQACGKIMTILYQELGGLRVTVPTVTQIAVKERNRRIICAFTGFNHEQLALCWGLSVRQVRRIVNAQE